GNAFESGAVADGGHRRAGGRRDGDRCNAAHERQRTGPRKQTCFQIHVFVSSVIFAWSKRADRKPNENDIEGDAATPAPPWSLSPTICSPRVPLPPGAHVPTRDMTTSKAVSAHPCRDKWHCQELVGDRSASRGRSSSAS